MQCFKRHSGRKLITQNFPQRRLLADYYAEISALDEQVGRLLKFIEEAGQHSKTMVWLFSEQGSQFPYGGKWSLYDNGIRVAGFVRCPGHIPSGGLVDAMLQYIDVVPTLVEIAGGNPLASDTGRIGAPDGKRGFDGRSFLPVLQGDRSVHRQYVFAQHTTVGVFGYREPYPSRAVRDEFSGAPVRAGARLVQVSVVKPSCNGVVYDDKHLWVRFDIGGERPRR